MLNVNILEKALAARFWSKADLVKAAGLSKVTVDRIFKDDADVRMSTIKAVLDALGLSFGAVLDTPTAPTATVTGHHNNTAVDGTLTITTGDAERVATLEQLVSTQQKYITMLEQQLDVLRRSARATGVHAPASP